MGYGDGRDFKNDRGGWTMFATIDGKRYKRTGATKTEARAKVSELRKQLALGPRAAASALTVAAMLDEWFKKDLKTKDRSPSTVERHRWAVDRIKAEIGKKQAATLKVRQVEDMLDNLQADGLGRSSLTKVLQTLSQAFDAAMRREDLDRNVAKLAKIPEAATRTAERTSLSPAEARKLLEALHDERNGLMLALSLRLGLRPGEAAGLFWEDVGTDAVNVTRGTVRHGGVTVVS